MNAAKKIQSFLQQQLSLSTFQILSESPSLTPFLKNLVEHPQVYTLPCADDMLCNTAVGMAISGAHVLVCLSSEQSLTSIAANLHEENYGAEFPLSLTFLVPSTEIIAQHQLPHYVYCQTGGQLLAQCQTHVRTNKISVICYNPAALFDSAQDSEAADSIVHSEGTHISILASGLHIDSATSFAKQHPDVEVIELISLHPICAEHPAKSIQKTGRVLLLDVPTEVLNTIIDSCFWSLEAQPEYTRNSDQSNLSRLRVRLLEA